jgi:RNA polymerase sigma-70 factor, ECF subfamily
MTDRPAHPGSAEIPPDLAQPESALRAAGALRPSAADRIVGSKRVGNGSKTRQRQAVDAMSASLPPHSPDPVGPPDVTTLLAAWGAGDRSALDALVDVVYADLHDQAARALRREAEGHTLSTTALVHEAYLRLVDQARMRVESRGQFYGVAARVMRQILVDHARSRGAVKRGGDGGSAARPITLDDAAAVTNEPATEILAVHEALDRLAALDPEQARLVELRYFAGFTIAESAIALGVSPATVKREWTAASAWLRRELADGPA